MRKRNKLVHGVGINDSEITIVDYTYNHDLTGKPVKRLCSFYNTWKSMLERCYSESLHKRRPSYIGCTVCDEWHKFSNFKKWMETQDWKGKQLDKDLLFENNKVYSPETCLFLSSEVNSFLTNRQRKRGLYPIGVHFKSGKFLAQISPLGTGSLYLGSYDTPEEASDVYNKMKFELAKILTSMQKDNRISEALIKRYRKE